MIANAPAHVCLDCGARLHGPFCHACGQPAQSRLVPLRRLAASALDETVGLDTRFARTLRLLFVRPGALTLAYWEGRRSRHTPPFRLYLFASLVYFVVLELSGSGRFFFFTVSGGGMELRQFVALLPKLMFLPLPSFAALLAVLFRRNRRLYAEHLVFALHYHAAAFLILPLDAAAYPLVREAAAGGGFTVGVAVGAIVAGAAQLAVLVYLFVALRRVYGRGRLGTFVRAQVLFFGYLTVLAVVGVLSIPELRRFVWTSMQG